MVVDVMQNEVRCGKDCVRTTNVNFTMAKQMIVRPDSDVMRTITEMGIILKWRAKLTGMSSAHMSDTFQDTEPG